MAMVLAPRVKRRTPSRERIDGNIVLWVIAHFRARSVVVLLFFYRHLESGGLYRSHSQLRHETEN